MIDLRPHTPPGAIGRVAGAWLATMVIASCAADPSGTAGDDSAASTVPAGAIQVGEGRYQMPMGRDADGCLRYQLHAPGQMVAQAISYRRPDGSFTMDKREAACGEAEPKP